MKIAGGQAVQGLQGLLSDSPGYSRLCRRRPRVPGWRWRSARPSRDCSGWSRSHRSPGCLLEVGVHSAILAGVEGHVGSCPVSGALEREPGRKAPISNGLGPPVLAQAWAAPMASATTVPLAELALSTTVNVPSPLDVERREENTQLLELRTAVGGADGSLGLIDDHRSQDRSGRLACRRRSCRSRWSRCRRLAVQVADTSVPQPVFAGVTAIVQVAELELPPAAVL